MKFTIDIDTGGTFTDGYVCRNGSVERIKVDTTPHDLTVGLFKLIEEAAKKFGYNTSKELLKNTEIIRFSTTIGTNTLLQKSGPKLGLLVSRNFESSAYSPMGSENPIFDFLINREMVCGIKGKVDDTGKIFEEIDEEEVRRAVKELLVRGARMIVVSLPNSFMNPALERRVKEVIEIDYPKHYLGSVPVLLSTEVDLSRNNMLRTNAALLNAYMHREMVKFLYKADEDLSKARYIAPLLIVHNWGGVARVSKTRSISTYNSGPVAGLFGAAYIGRIYNIPNLVTIDIGGTSTDLGVVIDGKLPLEMKSDIGGISTELPLVEVSSIGAGGGSIAKVENGKLRVGPESAGAIPGPVCYDLGGTEPTATDAAVVLGYINPDYFLGGKKRLNALKAQAVISERIAKPLKLKVEEAALSIIKEQLLFCEEAVKELLGKKNLKGENAVMLSFGGAGGIYCADIARATSISKVYAPPFASVFSAFGSSIMDIAHQYEASVMIPLRQSSGEYLKDLEKLNDKIEGLEKIVSRDMKAEGISNKQVTLNLEAQLSNNKAAFVARIPCPSLRFKAQSDIQALCGAFEKAYGKGDLRDEILLERIILRASSPISHPELPTFKSVGQSPKDSIKGQRKVFWNGKFKETIVHEQKGLQCGNIVKGAAVVEGEDTTILIPEGWQYSIDKHLFGIIERKGE